MRFQCALPLVCTVGVRLAIRNTLRPGVGIDSRLFVSSTSPVDAFIVSISGDSPVTVIVSASAPTSSWMSRPRKSCVPTRTPLRSKVLYPWTVALTVYSPGLSAGKEYSPTPLVTVSRVMLFDSLTIVTLAPGMTPCASLTTPRKPPWKDWARRGADATSAATKIQTAARTTRMGPPWNEDRRADSYTFLRLEKWKGAKAGRREGRKAGRQKGKVEGRRRKVEGSPLNTSLF